MEQNVTFFEREKPGLPFWGDWALLRQQGPRAELENYLAEFWIVDPVIPLVEPPDTTSHDDRNAVGNPLLAHGLSQRLHSRIRVLWLAWILSVGQAIVPTRKPGIFVDHG